jgi:hypothetical protein
MTLKLLRVLALALVASGLSVGLSGAQESVSVTVLASRSGTITFGCASGARGVTTAAVFTLTRGGDVTDGLTVSIAWGGDLSLGTTISPTSVTFTLGSSTATVTPVFATVPQSEGGLTLAVTSGVGYHPGDPSVATTTFSTLVPSCPAFPGPRLVNTPPPPLRVNPTYTG